MNTHRDTPGTSPQVTAPAGTGQAELIHVENVSVSDSGAHLLAPTDLAVNSGQVMVLRGENGSGKTTLLRVLAGTLIPTTGAARIGGEQIDERDRTFRRRVAVMIGLPPMAPDLTVRDHIALVSSTWEREQSAVQAATDTVLEEFGLTRLHPRFAHELSSGQTQLFGLALTFVRPFDVLLLDEPEQRLDPDRIELLARAILKRRGDGAAIILATHSATLAALTGDTTVRLGAE